jgi:hypothetical protein
MKIPLCSAQSHRPGSWRRRERGTAVVVVLLFLAIVFGYIASNAHTLHWLGRELRFIERQQIRRHAAPPPQGQDRAPKSRGANPKPGAHPGGP